MTSLLARAVMIGVCLWGGLTLQSWAQGLQERTEPPRKFRLATPGQPTAGIPYDEAVQIAARHTEELRQLPGVVSVGFSAEGLVVVTIKPEALPASVEGLPVFAVPPVDPRAAMGLEEGIPLPSPVAPQPVPPPVVEEPPLADCPAGMHREPGEVRCRFDTPPAVVEPRVKLIPPPPGVIVLRPGKVREQAESCPQGFEEVEGYNKWRFCVDPQKPEPLPNLWSPPIAGIPYEKALEIHSRHVYELSDLPGVESVGLGAEGINVYTTNPELVPKQIEGLRVITHPVPEGETAGNSHTYNTAVRPLHGAIAIVDNAGGTIETLTGGTVASGKPWLIFPAHILGNCTQSPPCQGHLPLNQCQHYDDQGQTAMFQPTTGGVNARVGFIQRWTPLGPTFFAADVAAAFMDSDFSEGNGSLAADRRVHTGASGSIAFSGVQSPIAQIPPPPVGLDVRMRSSLGSPHDFLLHVEEVGVTLENVRVCNGARANLNHQIRYRIVDSTFTVQSGDSGSPVFDLADRLVGMENACTGRVQPDQSLVCFPDRIYGTDIETIKSVLKFDRWYGTQTVPDQTIGIFNTNTAQWRIDNGNGRPDPCSTNVTNTTDDCFTYGLAGDTPISGDWDGNGSITIGVFRPANTTFYLRNSNSAGAPTITLPTGPFDYQPVAGKWGAGVNTKIGVFRSSTKEWYLDDGDFVIEGCPPDTCFTTTWTQTGDMPLAGDWDSNGSVTIGVFRPSNGAFYLSNAMPPTGVNMTVPTGPPSFNCQPVVGN